MSEPLHVLRTTAYKYEESMQLKETMQHGVTMGPISHSLRIYIHSVEMAHASPPVGERDQITLSVSLLALLQHRPHRARKYVSFYNVDIIVINH
jgi:hypothetical protein